jgi:hypothetical protein
MDPDLKSIVYNVLGGIIVSGLTTFFIVFRNRLTSFQLQRLLGFRFTPEAQVRITYGQFLLPPLRDQSNNIITHPYLKAPRRGGAIPLQGTASMEHPISECEVRASTYIASLLGIRGRLRPILVSDIEADSILDSNFVTVGGPGSNYKTADILSSTANVFIRMTQDRLFTSSGQELPYRCDTVADHGFILRVTPPEFTNLSWIVCAGLGEWGSSGSAWYLANRWKTLIAQIHPWAYRVGFMTIPDFLAIVRVVHGQDQSARLADLYRASNGQAVRVAI